MEIPIHNRTVSERRRILAIRRPPSARARAAPAGRAAGGVDAAAPGLDLASVCVLDFLRLFPDEGMLTESGRSRGDYHDRVSVLTMRHNTEGRSRSLRHDVPAVAFAASPRPTKRPLPGLRKREPLPERPGRPSGGRIWLGERWASTCARRIGKLEPGSERMRRHRHVRDSPGSWVPVGAAMSSSGRWPGFRRTAGPDGEGFWSDTGGQCALGHRRLPSSTCRRWAPPWWIRSAMCHLLQGESTNSSNCGNRCAGRPPFDVGTEGLVSASSNGCEPAQPNPRSM